MILVEEDNDLAALIYESFSDRYAVTRSDDLAAAARELREAAVDVLMADLDSSMRQAGSLLAELRRDHPELTIIATYLARPSGEDWSTRLSGMADLIIRKPYSVLDIDTVLRRVGGNSCGGNQ